MKLILALFSFFYNIRKYGENISFIQTRLCYLSNNITLSLNRLLFFSDSDRTFTIMLTKTEFDWKFSPQASKINLSKTTGSLFRSPAERLPSWLFSKRLLLIWRFNGSIQVQIFGIFHWQWQIALRKIIDYLGFKRFFI